MSGRRFRVGALASHPIQYHSPWFRHLSRHLDLDVYYCHRQSSEDQAEAGFDRRFEWDVPLLEGYRHHWLENVSKNPGVSSFFGCDTPELRQVISGGDFDAFLVFGWNRKSALQAFMACRRHGVPALARGDSQLATPRTILTKCLKFIPYRVLLPSVEGHLYVGEHNRAYLAHYGVPPERLFFAPHCVDVERFRRRAESARVRGDRARVRRSFGIPDDAFVVLFVGKLISRKRPGDLLEAVAEHTTKANGPPVHALLVGDGPLRTGLESEAEDRGSHRIHFAGFRNQSEMPRMYAAADVLALPSDGRETWGLVVNEAMACGLPCVVSEEVGCVPDMIEPGRTGRAHPVGDVEALAGAIRALRRDLSRDEGRRNIVRALAEMSARHSLEAATNGLMAALEHVA